MGLKPEEKAREIIDDLLVKAGWKIQKYREMITSAHAGFAMCVYSIPQTQVKEPKVKGNNRTMVQR